MGVLFQGQGGLGESSIPEYRLEGCSSQKKRFIYAHPAALRCILGRVWNEQKKQGFVKFKGECRKLPVLYSTSIILMYYSYLFKRRIVGIDIITVEARGILNSILDLVPEIQKEVARSPQELK